MAYQASDDLKDNTYTSTPLKGGDYLVRIRHAAAKHIRIAG
jgi:hypothetical protein